MKRLLLLLLLCALPWHSAFAATVSPDGTILLPGSGGSLITSAGTFSFSTATTTGGNIILFNSQQSGAATKLQIGSGRVYAFASDGKWYEWGVNGGWGVSAAPPPPVIVPPTPPAQTVTVIPGALTVAIRHIKVAADAPISAKTDYFLCVDNLAISPQLPASPPQGLSYLIKDCAGTASVATPLTVLPGSGATIDKAASYALTGPFQSIAVTYDGVSNWWRD